MKNNTNEPRRVLVIQTAFLGDIVLTIPLLRALKKYNPEAEVYLLTTPTGKELLKGQDIVDKIIVYDKKDTEKGISALINKIRFIRTLNIDTVISPHRSIRSGLIALMSGAHIRIGYRLFYLIPFYNIRIKRNKNIHEIDRIVSLLDVFGIRLSNEERYPLLKTGKITRQGRLIGIAPGSNWYTKQWTQQGYAELIKLLHKDGYSIVLIGNDSDKNTADKIKAMAGVGVNDMVGKTDIKELVELLSSIMLLVTNDNGAMQVAQAVNTPIVAIFGPTVPEQGFAPIRPNTIVVENKGLYCRPCSPHGPMECPEGHFLCMKSITPEVVFKAVNSMILNRVSRV